MVTPNHTQMNEFLEGDIDSPISMVNLLKFKEKAEYEDGRDTQMSGKEAYQIYAIEVQEHLKKVGAEIVFGGVVSRLMLGEVQHLLMGCVHREVEHRIPIPARHETI